MTQTKRKFTPRQLARRETILAAARDLIAERGYDGVTMRELADRANVALKTLYQQYDNKENLLITAVEQRHREVYSELSGAVFAKGIDKLFFIIESVANAMMANPGYARTLTPLMARGLGTSTFSDIRRQSYAVALEQIAGEGDFERWVDRDQLLGIMLRQVAGIYQGWARGNWPDDTVAKLVRLEISLVLAPCTRGHTRQVLDKTIKQLMTELRK